ncbi:hypothetical protein [Jhaorihella thermophila]|uniref:hypothetical protein n=1 Tax=Jhaorihella thermophila TaxID=488547 RepID=UPI0036D224D8
MAETATLKAEKERLSAETIELEAVVNNLQAQKETAQTAAADARRELAAITGQLAVMRTMVEAPAAPDPQNDAGQSDEAQTQEAN